MLSRRMLDLRGIDLKRLSLRVLVVSDVGKDDTSVFLRVTTRGGIARVLSRLVVGLGIHSQHPPFTRYTPKRS